MAGCVDRGWITEDDVRYRPIGIWSIPVSLTFAEGSPHSLEYPDITSLPFETGMKITQHVLEKVFATVIDETGARLIRVTYGPGSRERAILPMSTLQIQAPPEVVQTIRDMIGYWVQLDEVLSMKDSDCPDGIYIIDIVQLNGRNLADAEFAHRFWSTLTAAEPKLPRQHELLEVGGQPVIRARNTGQAWLQEDFASIVKSINNVAKQLGLDTVMERFLGEVSPPSDLFQSGADR